MKTILTYLKNSNTGDLILKQEFSETRINFPILYYRNNKPIGENLELKGYVSISKKKYDRLIKKK